MRGLIAITAAMLLTAGLLVEPADAQRERQQQDRTWQQQDQRQTRTQQGYQDERVSLRLAKADDLLGKDVKNFQDDNLGSIEDIVLCERHETISYVVVSTGGFLGIGRKFHAVPFEAFQILPPDQDDDEIQLVLNVSSDRFDDAEGFDKNNWPRQPNPHFHQAGAMGSQYGHQQDKGKQDKQVRSQDRQTRTQQQPGQDIESRRVSKMLGTDVVAGRQDEIGTLEDLVIDLQQNRVAYALISVDSDLIDIEEDLIALPWTAVRPQGEILVVQVDPAQLRQLAYNEDQGLVRLENRTYAARMHQNVKARPYWEGGSDQQMTRRDQNQQDRWAQNQDRSPMRGGQQTQIRGTIERIESEGRGRNQELVLHVRTTEGQQMAVRVGPEWYARDKDVSFREGEQITITGFVTGEGRQGRGQGRQMLMASVIQTRDQTLELRDSQGRPTWEQSEQARRPRNR